LGTDNLSPSEADTLSSLLTKLEKSSTDKKGDFLPEELTVVEKLSRWPTPQIWPVLDLFRIFVLYPNGAEFIFQSGSLLNIIKPNRIVKDNVTHPNNSLLCKCIANCLTYKNKNPLLQQLEMTVLNFVSEIADLKNASTVLALSTAILNFAVASVSEVGAIQIIEIINKLIPVSQSDPESQLRLLVALGTMIFGREELHQMATAIGLKETLQKMTVESGTVVELCIKDLMALLQQQ